MQKARWHHSNIYSNAPMPWMNRLTWSGTAMHAGIVPGYPASHGCIRLTYAFAPKFFQMSSVGDNVITSRGRPKPTPIEHGALFQPLPPPTLPMVEKEASLSPLERISTPIPAMAAAAASPVILAKAEMPTTVDSEAHPKVEEKAAPADEGTAKDADAEAASAMTAIEDNAAETESDPYRVHAITPDMSKSQERLAAPNPAPAAASAAEDKPADKPVAAAPAAPEPVAPKPEPAPVEIAAATPDLPPPAAAAKLNAGVDAAAVQAAEPRSGAPLRMLLTRRTQRDRIIGVQNIFASLGYLPAQDFDGTVGKATITAIKAFQKANGMAENGVFNDELVKKVYEVAGKGEPPAGHLYVRQEFDDVFDTAVSFKNAEEPLGTHVYIALNFAPGDTKIRWVTLDVTDGAGARCAARSPRDPGGCAAEDFRAPDSRLDLHRRRYQHQFGGPAEGRGLRGAGEIDRRQDQHDRRRAGGKAETAPPGQFLCQAELLRSVGGWALGRKTQRRLVRTRLVGASYSTHCLRSEAGLAPLAGLSISGLARAR